MPNLVPVVVEKEAGGERSYDIFSRLLKDRIVMLDTDVSEHSASLIVAQLLFLESQNSSKDIYMYINSPGGVVTAGKTFADLSADMERDFFMSAEEALAYGLIDKIIANRDSIAAE